MSQLSIIDRTIFGTDSHDQLLDGSSIGNDEIYGYLGNDSISSDNGDDTIFGGDGEDRIFVSFSGGNTTLYGENGNDSLTSTKASVTMLGGEGDDAFYVGLDTQRPDQVGGLIDGGSGWDILYVGGDDLSLWQFVGVEVLAEAGTPIQIEQLRDVQLLHLTFGLNLVGPGGILDLNARVAESNLGNAPVIRIIDGSRLTSSFYLAATNYADTVLGSAHDDKLDGREGDDSITGGEGHDFILGRAGNDHLDGGAGNDTLGGITGDNSLVGGAGDDLYYVDSTLDVVIEAAGGGADMLAVQRGGTWTLGAHVENLRFGGRADLTATGNAAANDIRGGAGSDVLHGRGGNDALTGGAGGDRLNGNAGDDVLSGGPGRDTLSGGLGKDTFVLDEARHVTTITDFSVADDSIQLTAAAFAELRAGDLPDAALRIVSSFRSGAPATADAKLIYVGDTGALFYDSDGSGAGAAITIARLTAGLALTADDFVVV